MKPDDFEQRLSRQPRRQIPPAWRAEILAAARDAQAACHPASATRHNWLETFSQQLATIFWPHPKAWAGLAAVWIFILAVNFSMRDSLPTLARQSAPPAAEVIVELKMQQRLFAELVGTYEAPDADRRKIFSPKPRSECVEILTT